MEVLRTSTGAHGEDAISKIISNLSKLPLQAIKAAQSTPSSKAETPQQKDVFILKSRSYYDLHAYLFAGMKLPSDGEAFKNLYPEGGCKMLTEVDAGIYNVTKNTFVDIYKSCERFNREDLGYIGIRRIENKGLKGQIAILLDEKYVEASRRDKAFLNAVHASKVLFEDLQKKSSEAAENVKKVITKLVGFQNETLKNQAAINFLKKEYKTGPVVNSITKEPIKGTDGNPHQPYEPFISIALVALNQKIQDDTKTRDKEYDNWKHDTIVAATAVTYIWIVAAAGIAVISVYASRAVNERKEYERLKLEIVDEEKEKATLVSLSMSINSVCVQFEDIGVKIAAALDALKEMKKLFDDQTKNFSDAATSFGFAKGTVDDSLYMRHEFLQDSLDDAVSAYKNIIKLAGDFKETEVKFETV